MYASVASCMQSSYMPSGFFVLHCSVQLSLAYNNPYNLAYRVEAVVQVPLVAIYNAARSNILLYDGQKCGSISYVPLPPKSIHPLCSPFLQEPYLCLDRR